MSIYSTDADGNVYESGIPMGDTPEEEAEVKAKFFENNPGHTEITAKAFEKVNQAAEEAMAAEFDKANQAGGKS